MEISNHLRLSQCPSYSCDDHTDYEDDVRGSGNDNPCCSSGNYSFYSTVYALNNVTSTAIVKASTDVVLSNIYAGWSQQHCNDNENLFSGDEVQHSSNKLFIS